MDFNLQRQEISEELLLFCVQKIKQNKIKIPAASEEVIKGLPAILQAIKKDGLPTHLLIKKLKGNLGSGVFLHHKAEPILKGEPIAPYAGEVYICPQHMENDSNYVFGLIPDLQLNKVEQCRWDPDRCYHPRRLYSVDLDAEKKGNFTRFINHSEEPNITAQFVRIPKNSEGLEASPFELIYVAKRKISPGEQLLVCYEGNERSYWGALKIKPVHMTPKTFCLNKHGDVVEEKCKEFDE